MFQTCAPKSQTAEELSSQPALDDAAKPPTQKQDTSRLPSNEYEGIVASLAPGEAATFGWPEGAGERALVVANDYFREKVFAIRRDREGNYWARSFSADKEITIQSETERRKLPTFDKEEPDG